VTRVVSSRERRGALDGSTPEELAATALRDDANTPIAFVPLEKRGPRAEAAGRKVSKRIVETHAEDVIATFGENGVKVSMLFCAGDLPNVSTTGLFVLPSTVMTQVVNAVFAAGRLGMFMPIPEQREHFIARWQAPGREVGACRCCQARRHSRSIPPAPRWRRCSPTS